MAVGILEADRDLQGAPSAVEVPVVIDAEPGVAAGGTRVGGAGGDVDAQHRWVRQLPVARERAVHDDVGA